MKKIAAVAVIGLILITILSACGLLQEPEAPSGTLEAVPVEIVATEPPQTAEPISEEATNVSEPVEEPDTEPDTEPDAEPEPPEEEAGQSDAPGPLVFSIIPDESQVRFELDEDLRGARKTVIGTSNQVVGEIALDSSDLSATQVGTILINARTLLTDNDFRNRAIQNEILDTGDFEFIEFTPTAVEGLPDAVNPGELASFVIIGDLTIRDFTNEVSFDVEAALVSPDEISGTASASVSRADYGLRIPEVPNVANVEEDVELYIDFIARAVR